MQAELRAKPSAQDLVNDLESLLGTVSLSVRAWYEVVGGVNFVGDHAGWRELLPQSVPTSEFDYLNPMHWLDPLFMYPLDEARLAHYRRWLKPGQVTHRLTLAEDETGKYLDSPRRYGEIILPSATMDAPFTYGGQLFVAYLRNCFRWGGFPGWARFEKRPEEDLAFVSRDLLPI